MNSILNQLRSYFKNTPREIIEKEWDSLSSYENIGPRVSDFIASIDEQTSEWEYKILESENSKVSKTPKYDSEFFLYLQYKLE